MAGASSLSDVSNVITSNMFARFGGTKTAMCVSIHTKTDSLLLTVPAILEVYLCIYLSIY